jgi:hypothetical protein
VYRSAPALDSPPLERFGYPELVYGAAPAAGADFSYAVTGAYFVRLVSVYCKFVADANVASREVVVSYEDAGGNRYGLAGINTTVTAGNTAYYAFSALQPEAIATVDSSALAPLSSLLLPPTHGFKLHVVNVQAGDQLSQIRFVVERFYTHGQPPGRYPPEPGD